MTARARVCAYKFVNDLKPAHVEEELKEGEKREDKISALTTARTLGQRLASHQTGQKKQVDGHGHHL